MPPTSTCSNPAALPRTRQLTLLELFEQMVLIRQSESRLRDMFNDGKIPGFIHLSIGQEAVAVGVAAALERDDTLASTHRGHGHGLAKGVTPEGLFHEISGNVEGLCKGRGGSLHVADFSVGMLGANGIVGGGIPIALGSALAHKTLGSTRVATVFFGDGALAEGVLYESLNLAALKRLPVLFVCENNGWSEFSPTSSQYVGTCEKLAATFDIRYLRVDGNDVEAVHAAAVELISALRAGAGPALLECITTRVKGHYEGDPQAYRKGVDERVARDPIDLALERLNADPALAAQVPAIEVRIAARVDAAARAAAAGTPPRFDAALQDVYA